MVMAIKYTNLSGKGFSMMRQVCKIMALCVVTGTLTASAQIITFNSPLAWVTQRNDSITIRAQIDTSQIKKKEFALSVDLVNADMKKKALAKKSFKVTDYTAEFAVGTIGQNLVGGLSYIKINWSIPGTANKGFISPIGIVALDKMPQTPPLVIARVQDGADAAAIAGVVQDYRTVAGSKVALAWNKDAFHIVLVKQEKAAPGTLRFSFDGKNAKNAFLSFADRVVMYQADKDSLWGLHYSRQMNGDTVKYVEKPWPNEVKKSVSGDKIVIRIPWYDSGIIPFDGRKFGLCMAAFDAKGKQTESSPASAQFFLPGTWSDVELGK